VLEESTGLPLSGVKAHFFPLGAGKPINVVTNAEGAFSVKGLAVLGVSQYTTCRYLVSIDLQSAADSVSRIHEGYVPLSVSPREEEFEGIPFHEHQLTFLVRSGPPVVQVRTITFAVDSVVGKPFLVLGKDGDVLLAGGTVGPGGRSACSQSLKDFAARSPLVAEIEEPEHCSLIRLPAHASEESLRVGPELDRIPLVTLRGQVVDRKNDPVAKAIVVLNRHVRIGFATMNYRMVTADSDGRFQLDVPAGQYQMAAVVSQSMLIHWSGDDNPSHAVAVSASGGTISLPLFELKR
jgi:hypothetical protein